MRPTKRHNPSSCSGPIIGPTSCFFTPARPTIARPRRSLDWDTPTLLGTAPVAPVPSARRGCCRRCWSGRTLVEPNWCSTSINGARRSGARAATSVCHASLTMSLGGARVNSYRSTLLSSISLSIDRHLLHRFLLVESARIHSLSVPTNAPGVRDRAAGSPRGRRAPPPHRSRRLRRAGAFGRHATAPVRADIRARPSRSWSNAIAHRPRKLRNSVPGLNRAEEGPSRTQEPGTPPPRRLPPAIAVLVLLAAPHLGWDHALGGQKFSKTACPA